MGIRCRSPDRLRKVGAPVIDWPFRHLARSETRLEYLWHQRDLNEEVPTLDSFTTKERLSETRYRISPIYRSLAVRNIHEVICPTNGYRIGDLFWGSEPQLWARLPLPLMCLFSREALRSQGGADSGPVTPSVQSGSCSDHPSCGRHPSFLKIAFYNKWETHVYLLSRGVRSKWARWITLRPCTTGERKPCSTPAGFDMIKTDIARTIDIQPNQEADRKTAH